MREKGTFEETKGHFVLREVRYPEVGGAGGRWGLEARVGLFVGGM